jgi:hypothetical protein
VGLLRGLLTDADREVRSAAAVMLFRIEEEAERSLHDDEQGNGDRADRLYSYAMSGLPDDVLRRFYLRQAETALRQATQERTAQAAHWIKLARVQRELHARETALESLDEALALDPLHGDAHALALEIAFQERQWERVQAHALQLRELAVADGDLADLVQWWTGAQAPGQGTPYGS